LLAGRIPLLLAACHRPTKATGLTMRYQLRDRLRRADDIAGAPPTAPGTSPAGAGSPAWSLALRPVSAVSGMDLPSAGKNPVWPLTAGR